MTTFAPAPLSSRRLDIGTWRSLPDLAGPPSDGRRYVLRGTRWSLHQTPEDIIEAKTKVPLRPELTTASAQKNHTDRPRFSPRLNAWELRSQSDFTLSPVARLFCSSRVKFQR